MATIDDLKPSFSQLDIDTKMALISEIRALRREPKPVKKRSTVRTSRKKKKAQSPDDLLAAMSSEQRQLLFEKLTGGK